MTRRPSSLLVDLEGNEEHKNMRLLASLCLAVVAFAACASAVEFSITDFTDKSLWDVYSQGGLTQGANPNELLLLQPGDLRRVNGYKRTITLGGDTVQVSTFTVRIDNDGADGFYYLLAAASGNTEPISNSVGIFIDTYKNAGEQTKPNGSHCFRWLTGFCCRS